VMKHDGDSGSIEPGKLADVILIDGNPAADIHALRNVTTVIRGGIVFDPREIEREIGIASR